VISHDIIYTNYTATGEPNAISEEVILNQSKAYDFCKVNEMGEWFDIFVRLIQISILMSGESKVGFLSNSLPWNLIHKVFLLHMHG